MHCCENFFPSFFRLLGALCACVLPTIRHRTARALNSPRRLRHEHALRYLAWDNAHLLAGYLATIRALNAEPRSALVAFDESDNAIAVRVKFRLNVTTIPCYDYDACTAMYPAYLDAFKQSMPSFAAVLKPNFVLAGPVIDAARAMGNIPVIGPDTMRSTDYTPAATNVVNFIQEWKGQFDHLFSYMMQGGQCSHAGILHRKANAGGNIEYIQSLFTTAKMAAPAALNVDDCTDAELERFIVTADPRRRCFLAILDYYSFRSLIARLSTVPSYMANPRLYSFYGVSHLAADYFLVGGSTRPFGRVHFIHWLPPVMGAVFAPVYAEWQATIEPAEAALFQYESVPAGDSPFAAEAHAILVLAAEAARSALHSAGDFQWIPGSGALFPVNHSSLMDFFHRDAIMLEGYPFHRLTRACPPEPIAQVCFCNTVARVSYVYRMNASDPAGGTYVRYDDAAKGQREMSSVDFPETCRFVTSSWSYPIGTVALFPEALAGTDENSRLDGVMDNDRDTYIILNKVFDRAVYDQNYAPVRPPRPRKHESMVVPAGQTTQSVVDAEMELADPFVIYGSMEGVIGSNPQGVLTMLPRLMGVELEDPPLVPHDGRWKWYNVQLQPCLADYIHSLVSYYAEDPSAYTAIHAIASTQREAELISMSFATFGFLVEVSDIVVSSDSQLWHDTVSAWASEGLPEGAPRSAHWPFIIAVEQSDATDLIFKAATSYFPWNRGTLACATSVVTSYDVALTIGDTIAALYPNGTFGNASNGVDEGDIIFGAFRREWWTPDVLAAADPAIRWMVPNPRYHIATLAVDLVNALANAVWYNYGTTAAQVLYKQSVVTAAETVFGPFYNATCAPHIVGNNTRDRICQCTKGVRTVFVHSMRDMYDGTASRRTGRYSYTMTTCGVEYAPYVPPPVAASNSLAAGAIAGIAVGASVFGLLVIGALAYSVCRGRNNRAAPTDPTRPFTIVFTDIQSSTALWARAPSAMSASVEQHHRLIRKAISSNSGYEVKTVGDSFMVAFKRRRCGALFPRRPARPLRRRLEHRDRRYLRRAVPRSGGGGRRR